MACMKCKKYRAGFCSLILGVAVAFSAVSAAAQDGSAGTVLTVTVPEQPEEAVTAPKDANSLKDIPLPEGWEWEDGNIPLTPGSTITAEAVYRGEDGEVTARREITITVPKAPQSEKPSESEPVSEPQTEKPSEGETEQVSEPQTEEPGGSEQSSEPETEPTTGLLPSPTIPSGTQHTPLPGSDSTWKADSEEGLTIKLPEEMGAVQTVLVDGKELDADDYTVSGQPPVLTLTTGYLSLLDEGEHTILVQGEDGYIEYSFTVEYADDIMEAPETEEDGKKPFTKTSADKTGSAAKTGDETDAAAWFLLAGMSFGIFILGRKRRRERN